MLDDLRNYLQLAGGMTEATSAKAREAISGLLAQGLTLSTRAMPAPQVIGQVQGLADDLVASSKGNREALLGTIRAEVDRAVGRMGFVREDELAALRRHVQRLEKQIADLGGGPAESAGDAGGSTEASAAPTPRPRRKRVVVDEAKEAE